ncbi:MAG TPA: DUF4139 domain-containing protein [Phycisphaerae bacterium]|nr:DUF4139 domain-containing protein [Phycisphaerae bacterium]
MASRKIGRCVAIVARDGGRLAAAILPLWLCAAGAAEEPKMEQATALTIYSSAAPGAIPPEMYQPAMQQEAQYYGPQSGRNLPGYAVVKQERSITLEGKRSVVRFSDVAARIDPTTVTFASLTDPAGTSVLEQNYQFDLVSAAKLMERYLDREVTVEQIRGNEVATFKGTLLSTSGGLTLKGGDGGIVTVQSYSNVRYPELPGGLITKPTLVWDISTDKPGPHRVRVTYQTGGMVWWADYNIVFAEGKDANSGTLDVGAWVSILNQSGGSYADAKLKLIAGEVHRAPQVQVAARGFALDRAAKAAAPVAGFEEKAFFEYHLYTLGRPTTLPDNSTKQIELFPAARGVPCEKVLVYYGLPTEFRGFLPSPMTDRNYGTQTNKKVDIYLRFRNAKENGMGMPLPAGRIRVSKLDPADNTLEFIGEDTIDHTPKDEEVLVKMGSAFDVVGERKQIDFKIDTARNWIDETIEIKLRNHKDEPVTVIVKENLYRWVNWKITETTHDYRKVDARTIEFPVKVEKDGEKTIRYTVHYTW